MALTDVILAEVMSGAARIGESEIGRAIQEKRLEVIEDKWPTSQFPELDEGEVSVLRAEANLGGPILLLIDECADRAVARELGISVTGTAGIIVAAKQRSLIPAARPVFERPLTRDFWMSAELIRAASAECGEH